MTDPVLEIPFEVWDLREETTGPIEHIKPGFYFTFPLTEQEIADVESTILEGPFETRQAAEEKARAFIRDALTNHQKETK